MAGQIRAFNSTLPGILTGVCKRCLVARMNRLNLFHSSRYYQHSYSLCRNPLSTSGNNEDLGTNVPLLVVCGKKISSPKTSQNKSDINCYHGSSPNVPEPGHLRCLSEKGFHSFVSSTNTSMCPRTVLPFNRNHTEFGSASLLYCVDIVTTSASARFVHTSSRFYKEESKVEKTVQALKDEAKEDAGKKVGERSVKVESVMKPTAGEAVDSKSAVAKKKSLGQQVVAEVKHYYNGFKLLFFDVRVAIRYVWRILRGGNLTRRERRQLVRTTSDMFRLVPFSVFVIVPFMEFLLPVALKLFPNMLPSTFKEDNKEQEKIRKKLKVKLEMAKFLQDTLEETAVTRKGAKGEKVAEFAHFMERIRATGEPIDNDEILKYSKLFEDEITLDNLKYPQLRALCKLIDISVVDMSETVLRFQLRLKMRELEADDRMIWKEGLESLNTRELQEANRARGMRSLGMPDLRLRSQLSQWLDLHLRSKIPTSLLLLSRTLYLPESVPTADQLKAIITELPSSATEEAKVKISDVSGDRVDNKAMLETIKQEESIIQAEKEEQLKEKEKKKAKEQEEERKRKEAAEELLAQDVAEAITKEAAEPLVTPSIVDSAPELKEMPGEVLTDKAELMEEKLEQVVEQEAADEEHITTEDLEEIEDILESVAEERNKMKIEQEDLKELKQDVSEYMENVEELKAVVLAGDGEKLEESKAAQRLRQTVNGMIVQMDSILCDLSKEKEELLENIEVKEVKMKRSAELKEDEGLRQKVMDQISKHKQDLISINELQLAMKRIQKVPDDTKFQKIAQVLDTDKDGVIDITDALKVIELVGKDNVNLSSKQVSQVTELLRKEEIIEQENKQTKIKEKIEKQAERQETQEDVTDKQEEQKL